MPDPTPTLTDEQRAFLLTPCACGHTINDHGGFVACWLCEDEGDECGTPFEALLAERIGRMVADAEQRGRAEARGTVEKLLFHADRAGVRSVHVETLGAVVRERGGDPS